MPDDLVEEIARVLCEKHIRRVRRHDTTPERIDEMMPSAVDMHWRDFADDAAAVAALITRRYADMVTIDRMKLGKQG